MRIKVCGAIIGMIASPVLTLLLTYAVGVITKPSGLTYSEAFAKINEATFQQDTLRAIPIILMFGLLIGYACGVLIAKRQPRYPGKREDQPS